MSKKFNDEFIALLDELIENGDFFTSAIESNNYEFDCEEWKARALKLLNEAKSNVSQAGDDATDGG
ncbi:hypothetical protein EC843_10430 [Buttiauxella sp. JUb87]|uniref:hypothetical protein n=1 Tax=Buttiauxella sp. JUb87 TaxID=2485129 RepID=UPI00105BA5D2|nr:hypothetical protein [Buttiauxella sp. JUb87]TDN51021.1 hypothetical protein EC843_10430 [Buttiauxella sp. JUb87]